MFHLIVLISRCEVILLTCISGVMLLWTCAGTAAGVGTGRSSGGGAQPLGKAIKDVLDHLRLQGEAVEVSSNKKIVIPIVHK